MSGSNSTGFSSKSSSLTFGASYSSIGSSNNSCSIGGNSSFNNYGISSSKNSYSIESSSSNSHGTSSMNTNLCSISVLSSGVFKNSCSLSDPNSQTIRTGSYTPITLTPGGQTSIGSLNGSYTPISTSVPKYGYTPPPPASMSQDLTFLPNPLNTIKKFETQKVELPKNTSLDLIPKSILKDETKNLIAPFTSSKLLPPVNIMTSPITQKIEEIGKPLFNLTPVPILNNEIKTLVDPFTSSNLTTTVNANKSFKIEKAKIKEGEKVNIPPKHQPLFNDTPPFPLNNQIPPSMHPQKVDVPSASKKKPSKISVQQSPPNIKTLSLSESKEKIGTVKTSVKQPAAKLKFPGPTTLYLSMSYAPQFKGRELFQANFFPAIVEECASKEFTADEIRSIAWRHAYNLQTSDSIKKLIFLTTYEALKNSVLVDPYPVSSISSITEKTTALSKKSL